MSRNLSMDIVYLDQNKWIELARARSGAVRTGPIVDLYPKLQAAVRDGRVLFPLSASHVLETSKRNDPRSRLDLSTTQAELSRGIAFRSRASRLYREICFVMHKIFKYAPPELPDGWFLGQCFLDAFESLDSSISETEEAKRISRILEFISPVDLYMRYMNTQDDEIRRVAHASLSVGISEIVSHIENRRNIAAGTKLDLRRRAYYAQQFIAHQELFIRIADHLGYSYDYIKSIGAPAVKALVEDVPTLNVEVEMSARLEAEPARLTPNDVFDMQAFYTAIPYCSHVVAERASISRARQAKLNSKYNVALSHSLTDLFDIYR